MEYLSTVNGILVKCQSNTSHGLSITISVRCVNLDNESNCLVSYREVLG